MRAAAFALLWLGAIISVAWYGKVDQHATPPTTTTTTTVATTTTSMHGVEFLCIEDGWPVTVGPETAVRDPQHCVQIT